MSRNLGLRERKGEVYTYFCFLVYIYGLMLLIKIIQHSTTSLPCAVLIPSPAEVTSCHSHQGRERPQEALLKCRADVLLPLVCLGSNSR